MLSKCLILLAAVATSSQAYLSDTNDIKSNRLLFGGGMRQEGIGLTYQRRLDKNLNAEGNVGFFPTDGLHLNVGANKIWFENSRLRPKIYAGFGYLSGISLKNLKITVNDDTATADITSKTGLSVNAAVGLQFRIVGRFGIEWDIGYRQMLLGGATKIDTSTNEKVARDFMNTMAGSGVLFSGRGFWEF